MGNTNNVFCWKLMGSHLNAKNVGTEVTWGPIVTLKAQSHRNNWWIAYAPRIKLVYPRFMRAKKMAFSLTCRRWIACKTRTRPKFSYISRGNGSFCGCFTHGSLIIHVCIPYNSRMKCAWVTNETRVWRMKYGRNAHDSLMNRVWFTHGTRMIHLWNANIMDIHILPKTCMYYKLQWEKSKML